MNFKIGGVLPATAAQLWTLFFDVREVASLIPGCEDVTEIEPLKEFSAVMKQKVGPFKLEVPTRILVDSHTTERHVRLCASGRDKRTATTIDVTMEVNLDEQSAGHSCRLDINADMQIAGRLASLGYPIIKKKSEELFTEFERRLRDKLGGVNGIENSGLSSLTTTQDQASPSRGSPPFEALQEQSHDDDTRKATGATVQPNGSATLVLNWPRAGINTVAGLLVAAVATALDQSSWWWLVAPALGAAAAVGRRGH